MNKVYIAGKDLIPESIVLKEGERLDMTLVVLPGLSCDIPVSISLEGQGSYLNLRGLYVCGADERVSIRIELNHKVGGCESRQLFKGIVAGTAKTDFHGKIVVAQDAQKTIALQENHNLLLSDSARADSSPQLEIYADDVKCSHGATMGRLDEEEQFYMRSRGISLEEAKFLQIISFLSPVISELDEAERERVEDRIEKAVRSII